MKNFLLLLVFIFICTQSFATVSRYLDGQYITNGANTLTLPTATDTLVGKATTDIFTNKSMSGASNTFTFIPVSAIGNGSVLSGSNTGDVTIGTANGLSLSLQALSLAAASSSVTGALTSTDWSTFNGKLTSPLTTKGDLLGFSTVNARLGVGTNGQILTADSAQALGVKWAVAPVVAPSLNGGSGSPESVTAAGGITLASINYNNFVWVEGNAGAVTVTATPSITNGTSDGQQLKIVGTSDTNTITLQDNTGLVGSKLSLNGNWTGKKDSVLNLYWDATQTMWVESSRR